MKVYSCPCGKTNSADFYPHNRSKCRECVKAYVKTYNQRNPEAKKAYQKKYRDDNKKPVKLSYVAAIDALIPKALKQARAEIKSGDFTSRYLEIMRDMAIAAGLRSVNS